MDKSLIHFVDELLADKLFRAEFVESPEEVLGRYGLQGTQKDALLGIADDAYGRSERGLRNLSKILKGIGKVEGVEDS